MSICEVWRHFLAHFLYPLILITMFCLLAFLDDFSGVILSFEWGPELCSEQRPELFEIGLDLISEAVDGFAFEDVGIIASIGWLNQSRKWTGDGDWLRGCCISLSSGVSGCTLFLGSTAWVPFGVFPLHGPLVRLLVHWPCKFWFLTWLPSPRS